MGNETTVWTHELEYLNYLAYHSVDKENQE